MTLELIRFATVGASGWIVNLVVFSTLLRAGLPLSSAAVGAFLVAVTNNYVLNRAWTFAARRGDVIQQGTRYLTVSLLALGANLLMLHALALIGMPNVPAQAVAILFVTPVSFLGNRLWSFGG